MSADGRTRSGPPASGARSRWRRAVRSAPATRATASAAAPGRSTRRSRACSAATRWQRAGGWDESLPANEDYALNWVLRERGGIVWFDPALVVDYRPRGDVRALARQYFGYGRWKAAMLARHPRSLRARQLAAPLLLAALAGSGALAMASYLAPPPLAALLAAAAAATPLLYATVVLGASALIGLRRRRIEALLTPVVAVTIHFAWATGFIAGVLRLAPWPRPSRRRGSAAR